MLGFILEVLVGAVVMLIAPVFIPSRYRGPFINVRGYGFNLGSGCVRTIGLLIILLGVVSTSYIDVGDGKFAQIFREIGGGSLEGGKIVAIKGENGPQARVLRPGFHFEPLLNILNTVDASKKEFVIPAGKIGVLTAKDGDPLRPGQVFADPFPAEYGIRMLDADTFLQHGGQRGPQLTVLTPSTYIINDYLWNVELKDAQDVETGFVGVVKSNIWAPIDFGTLKAEKPDKCDVIKNRENILGRIEAPIVPVGCVGVWQASLQPGRYNINPDAFKIIPIDTRAQVWTYAGGYTRRVINLSVDGKGEITQASPPPEEVKQDQDNADRAVFVKMEGWDIPLELRVVAQVSPEEASCVVAGVGSLKQVEDRVLTPSIRAITRDVAGGTYEVEEVKVDENNKPILEEGKPVIQKIKRPTKALDLINQRPLIEGEIERRIRPEAAKSCVTIREVRLGEPAIPPELLVAVRREQLATQLAKAYIQEKAAQDQRISSEKSKATANNQDTLVKAEINVQASAQNALAARNEGEGQSDKLKKIAEGQRAQMEVLGASATVQLQQFNAIVEKVFTFADAHPEVLTAALSNAGKFVPNISVSGSGSGLLDGILAKMLSGNISDISPVIGSQPKH
jgi:hypothetical protein